MLIDCPHCGQKLRPQWTRCPGCRELIAAIAPEQDAPKAPASRRTLWVGAAVAIGALLLFAVISRNASSHPAEALPAASESVKTPAAAPAPAASSADGIEPAPARSVAAVDTHRAAVAAYAVGDFASALAQLEALVASAPDDAEARNNLGQLLVRQGRVVDALPHFDAAIRLNEQRWSYRFNRARAYGLVDRWNDAVADYRIAAQLLPDDHATQYNLGLALLRVRDYAGAATVLEHAVAAAPEQHDFLITLGTAYMGASQQDRARATFERFLELAPNDPESPKVKDLLHALTQPGQ